MLQTDRGEYESLALLRAAYLETYRGNPPIGQFFNTDEWSEDTLHISELGKCPRQQMYRLLGTPKQAKTESRQANDALMFWTANMIHALTAGALEWAGILVGFEKSLKGLPEGWSGHYDVIFSDREAGTLVGWDGKTVRPNAFGYSISWPKPEHVAQVQGYLRFEKDVASWFIEYIDRGGSNTPQLKGILRCDEWVDERMELLDTYHEELRLDILPPVLDPEFTIYYRKVTNEPIKRVSSVNVGPSWQCEWCPYLDGVQSKKTKEWHVFESSPCKPDMTKTQVGKAEKGTFKCCSKEYEESLSLWLKTQVLEYQTEEDAVE
jgi:hypothetical protein